MIPISEVKKLVSGYLKKTHTRLLLLLTVLSVLQIAWSATPLVLSGIPNGGFETFPAGGNNDWFWPSSGWAWDGVAHSGGHSARVTRASGSETPNILSAFIPVTPNATYSLTYWLKSEAATWYPRVVINQYTSSNGLAAPYQVAFPNMGSGTFDWKPITYRFQTASNTSFVRIRVYLSTDTTGTFWFDDFNLEGGAPARFALQPGYPVAAAGPVWLASPAVADINRDGSPEVLIGASSVVSAWNKNGVPLPGFPLATGDLNIVAQIALGDVDGDGNLEIAAGTRAKETEGQCRVYVWRADGSLLPGWPQSVAWSTQYSNNNCWITSVIFADIAGDQKPEIIASTTNNGAANVYADIQTPNLYAWNANNSLVVGNWPNQQTTAGIYGALAVGDISGDGKADVIVGRDYIYLNAYKYDGLPLPGWPIRTFVNRNNGDYDTELRIGYSVNAPIIADLENDGKKEIIVVGHVSGPGNPVPDISQNNALLVLHPDGSRKPGWETAAVGTGSLSNLDLPWQGPAVADLNSDGKLEIIVATKDGWIRAYKADKTLLWAYNYAQGSAIFATDPVVGDIDGDGALEVLFGTYVIAVNDKDKDGPVGLWALEANGAVVSGFPLSVPTPGIRAAPTLADMDNDGKLEILVGTRTGHVFAWRTEAPANANLLPWPTGRRDFARSATYPSQIKRNLPNKYFIPLTKK